MGRSVLANHRTGMVQANMTPLFRGSTQDSNVLAYIEDVVVHLKPVRTTGVRCRLRT